VSTSGACQSRRHALLDFYRAPHSPYHLNVPKKRTGESWCRVRCLPWEILKCLVTVRPFSQTGFGHALMYGAATVWVRHRGRGPGGGALRRQIQNGDATETATAVQSFVLGSQVLPVRALLHAAAKVCAYCSARPAQIGNKGGRTGITRPCSGHHLLSPPRAEELHAVIQAISQKSGCGCASCLF
jgi:hypothetical protein